MIIKLVIDNRKKMKKISVWVQKDKEFEQDLQQLFEFFKDSIIISKERRFHKYYKITSQNPAVILSLVSTLNELIPDTFFNSDNTIEEELIDIDSI
ncbi:MAG: hypothetical protein ACFFAO_17625 [Candidatus Hermodarchaeota archaeon]